MVEKPLYETKDILIGNVKKLGIKYKNHHFPSFSDITCLYSTIIDQDGRFEEKLDRIEALCRLFSWEWYPARVLKLMNTDLDFSTCVVVEVRDLSIDEIDIPFWLERQDVEIAYLEC